MSASYDIHPKVKTYPDGTIFKSKYEILGTNSAGVNPSDPDFDENAEDVVIPVDTILTFVDDRQFIASSKRHSQSAWIRFQFIMNDKMVWVTMLQEPSRIWNFETYGGKRKKLSDSVDEKFELICMGGEKKE